MSEGGSEAFQLWAPRLSSEWNIQDLLEVPLGSPQHAPWDPLPFPLLTSEAPHPASSTSSTDHQVGMGAQQQESSGFTGDRRRIECCL